MITAPRVGLPLSLGIIGLGLGLGYVGATIRAGSAHGDPSWLGSKLTLIAACFLIALGGTIWLRRRAA